LFKTPNEIMERPFSFPHYYYIDVWIT